MGLDGRRLDGWKAWPGMKAKSVRKARSGKQDGSGEGGQQRVARA